MSLSTEVESALAAAFWPCEPRQWDGPPSPLQVVLPDGKTVAYHMDEGEVALSIVTRLVAIGVIDPEVCVSHGFWMRHSTADEMVRRLTVES